MLLLTALLALAADDPLGGRTAPFLRKHVDIDRPLGPTGTLVAEFAGEQRVPIVLDERADLKAPVRVFYKQTRVGDVLAAAARHASGRFALVGEVGYFGTAEAADRAAAGAAKARETLAKMPKAAKAALLARKHWEWDGKKTVAELVGEVFAAAELPLAGDKNQLDVAPLPGRLPEVPALDAALAWCALADCTLELDLATGGATIAAAPSEADLDRVVRCRSVADAAKRAADANALPAPPKGESAAPAESRGATVRFRGPWSALWSASGAEDPPKLARAAPPGTKVSTYRMDFRNGTLRSFGEQLAKATGKEVKFDEAALQAAGKSLQDTVTCTARNVSLEDLLELGLGPLELTWKVGAATIEIAAKPK